MTIGTRFLATRRPKRGLALAASAHLRLAGAAGVYASTPDGAGLALADDAEWRVRIRPATLAPAAAMTVLSQWGVSTNFSWRIVITTAGALRLQISTSGSNSITLNSTVTLPAAGLSSSQVFSIKVTMDRTDGSLKTARFFYSLDGVTFTQLGDPVTSANLTALFNSTAPVEVGADTGGTGQVFAGDIFSAQIRSAIDGTVIASPNFAAAAANAATLDDAQANTWTITGAARLQKVMAA